jgi:hypothetical protein
VVGYPGVAGVTPGGLGGVAAWGAAVVCHGRILRLLEARGVL